jgi:hypothetical protein
MKLARFGRTGLVAAALLAIGGGVAGCYAPGGAGYSNDTYTFTSEPYSPKTVFLKDLRTQQTLWTHEVPVGRQLVVSLFAGPDQAKPMPDTMRFSEMKHGDSFGTLSNSMAIPSVGSREIGFELRKIPEFAAAGGELGAAGATGAAGK